MKIGLTITPVTLQTSQFIIFIIDKSHYRSIIQTMRSGLQPVRINIGIWVEFGLGRFAGSRMDMFMLCRLTDKVISHIVFFDSTIQVTAWLALYYPVVIIIIHHGIKIRLPFLIKTRCQATRKYILRTCRITFAKAFRLCTSIITNAGICENRKTVSTQERVIIIILDWKQAGRSQSKPRQAITFIWSTADSSSRTGIPGGIDDGRK